ncbi:MAG: hypothetical protein ACI9XB_004576 [Gammaproteobacteria bacterium]|jgi:hypothetical protein
MLFCFGALLVSCDSDNRKNENGGQDTMVPLKHESLEINGDEIDNGEAKDAIIQSISKVKERNFNLIATINPGKYEKSSLNTEINGTVDFESFYEDGTGIYQSIKDDTVRVEVKFNWTQVISKLMFKDMGIRRRSNQQWSGWTDLPNETVQLSDMTDSSFIGTPHIAPYNYTTWILSKEHFSTKK